MEPNLSVVIPVYNERWSVEPLLRELQKALWGWSYEVLFVDDGSTDGTEVVLRRLAEEESGVRVIRFRRNFGKAQALAAGFRESVGARVATMDGDLQDDAQDIPRLLALLEEGYDLAVGWKRQRYDSWSRRWSSWLFNAVTSSLTGLALHDYNSGLKVYRRSVVSELSIYGEQHRFIPALVYWKGFRVTELPVHHRPRAFGRSKYGPGRLLAGFLDLMTVLFLTRYHRKPLHLFGLLGLLSLVAGVALNSYLAILWFQGQAIGTQPLLQLGVLLTVMGVQFLSLGLLAELLVQGQSPQRGEEPVYEIQGRGARAWHEPAEPVVR